MFVPGGWLVHRASPARPTPPTDTTPTTVAALLAGPAGQHLTDADWRLQIGSAVLIGAGSPQCGGAVTTIGGHRYVTAARHCLTDVLERGVVSPEPGLAQEVTGRLGAGFQVFDPVTHRRIARLDRIAVGTGDADVLVATTRDETDGFRAKPARSLTRAPAVGDEVATLASSGASGFLPQRLVGVYLGTWTFRDGDAHYTVDLVGYRQPASATQIGKGHSGHSPTGAGGGAFGPILFSINRDTPADARRSELRDMGTATGLDLGAEGFVAIDETLHLTASDYARFDRIFRG